MADRYLTWEALKAAEEKGTDYEIETRSGGKTLVMAPHGGSIEGGTTELARAIAGDEHGFYSFMGIKPSGNVDLHITSTKFLGEEHCKKILESSERVVALHGVRDGEVAYVGGLDTALRDRIVAALTRYGIPASIDSPDGLGGTHVKNVCNLGTSEAGVQIEIAKSLRERMFDGSTSSAARADETRRQPLFFKFVDAVREALEEPEG